ncbi:hypothetical protein P8C59_008694 [Phyllachora maydis]|uniref:Uncharacterized protein n=1 Tax=Phyllachora maydis TaxID=1825666 RepID=A0AAD9MH80_9PEZI|nr:hypothetical protein P8C59_008694 [Phyllachora maydis]
MPPSGLDEIICFNLLLLSLSTSLFPCCLAAPKTDRLPSAVPVPVPVPLHLHLHLDRRNSNSNPLKIDWEPAPSPEDGPPGSANALRDPAYLPAQVSGIIGSYALSLLVVATLLLLLSKRRREHLQNADAGDYPVEAVFNPFPDPFGLQSEEEYRQNLGDFQSGIDPGSPRTFHRNLSLPCNTSPISPSSVARTVAFPSPSSTVTHLALGLDLAVDQSVVAQDRAMAQRHLENMYRHVMEQEEAKEQGREYVPPPQPPPQDRLKKEKKNKPSRLNLAKEEKQSRASSMLSILMKSPRKRAQKGIAISSPVTLTPMSATFPRDEEQEMKPMSPRHYNPPPPPPVPAAHGHHPLPPRRTNGQLPSPELSPHTTQSIDERLSVALGSVGLTGHGEDHGASPTRPKPAPLIVPLDRQAARDPCPSSSSSSSSSQHRREPSPARSANGERDGAEADAVSAVSARSTRNSTSGFVGLPTSPKPGVNRFPSRASPVPSAPPTPRATNTSQRVTPLPPAIRTGGLPLRAYEPSLASPSMASHTTKQTVFTRLGPLSPGGMHTARTPYTGAPVPYTPYQPFSPVVPITPSLVTREDRKRMRRMVPKTPTVEMVKSDDEMW